MLPTGGTKENESHKEVIKISLGVSIYFPQVREEL